nr:RNA polymerase-binding protein RbpA [Propionibacterium sp.]
MADKSLKGHGLGSRSLADGAGVELAARRQLSFDCPKGHHFTLTFAEEAELPTEWECPRCGKTALRADGVPPAVKEEKHQRTHWDMLRERRSIPELEEILAERLEQLRKEQ